MNRVKTILAAVAVSASASIALANPATADEVPTTPAVQACLDRHPGAVAFDGVTPGDDTVCVESDFLPSEGNDTYLWVGADTEASIALRGANGTQVVPPDPGADTLSLADWSVPLIETYNEIGVGGLFGVRIFGIDDAEVITYTRFNDVVGDPGLCGRGNGDAPNGQTYRLGAGADTVRCLSGDIFTEGGDDTVIGPTTGTEVVTGPGADEVLGDIGADVILLGNGADFADVDGGGTDTVRAGRGKDVVDASRGDRVTSARVR